MSDDPARPRDRNAARKRAQNHFAAAEQRDTLVKQMVESERNATAAKTAKLKALRLAKEETDAAEAKIAAANAPKKPAKKTRART
ncbi:MAG TPA: hypothetical protein VHU87_10020 [Rhizomicrobium sp.]|jgi:hypothetical protein|nr:hypothetical protein [Rhizomicrobium sp.]